ncbi:hypothetical protein [Lysinibacillus fusiformis]|uniref:hypothetical protein n=1 Tax=Lysinibacillus fusiformis TaxID=28031 RepID=UPI0018801B48|nr:hypothetical protein [Lysinibacillus fusiformis]MBD8523888.1 hypothetical protein [Lysinibacillus fusiformis]
MNNIVAKITEQGLLIEKDYGIQKNFAYHSGGNLITYPAFEDLNKPKAMFALAHELGHHYQRQHFSKNLLDSFSGLARMNHWFHLFFFPYLLWEEIDAWIRAWKICREAKVSLKGFIPIALRGLFSYVKSFICQIFTIVLTIYILAVLIVNDIDFIHESIISVIPTIVFIMLIPLIMTFFLRINIHRRI